MSRQESFFEMLGRHFRLADIEQDLKQLNKEAPKQYHKFGSDLFILYAGYTLINLENIHRTTITESEELSRSQIKLQETKMFDHLILADDAYIQNVFLFFMMQLSFEEAYYRAGIEATCFQQASELNNTLDDINEALQYDFIPSPHAPSDTSFANIAAPSLGSPR